MIPVFDFPLLSLMMVSLIVGAFFVLSIGGEKALIIQNVKKTGLFACGLTFLFAMMMFLKFDPNIPDLQFVENTKLMSAWNFSYHLGVDGLSLSLILLATLVFPLALVATFDDTVKDPKLFMILFLLLESLTIGVFCAQNIIFFYIFFEASLIPMLLIIGIWGGERRIYAAIKFFLFTLAGSVFMMLAIIYLCNKANSSEISALLQLTLTAQEQKILWCAFFLAFAVKLPLWPLHTWLPDAHVEAPTAGSVILAALLLKMGGYGVLRFCLPLFPLGCFYFSWFVYALSLMSIIYAAVVAFAQTDIKKLVAYASISHMGFVILGAFSGTEQGIEGAAFQMLSHGFISAGLFLCIGVVYKRFHTRDINAFGGLKSAMPIYGFTFLALTMASSGLPGTSGFIGEFLVLLSSSSLHPFITMLAGSSIILSACYGLWLYRKILLGLPKAGLIAKDLNANEKYALFPLIFAVIALGVYPEFFLERMRPALYTLNAAYSKVILNARISTP